MTIRSKKKKKTMFMLFSFLSKRNHLAYKITNAQGQSCARDEMASMIFAGAASLEAGRNHQERSLTRSLTHIRTTRVGPHGLVCTLFWPGSAVRREK